MPIVTLSADFVRNAICPPGKSKENYYDTNITGFILEVRSSGKATFALRFKDPHGTQRQIKIGDSKSLSFDKARNAAKIIRSRVVLGGDPAAEKRTKRMVPTLAEFCRERYVPFIKSYKRSWMKDESFLRNHILPKFGALRLDEIEQQAIIEFQGVMKNEGYALGMANNVVILMKYIFNLAQVVRPRRQDQPCCWCEAL